MCRCGWTGSCLISAGARRSACRSVDWSRWDRQAGWHCKHLLVENVHLIYSVFQCISGMYFDFLAGNLRKFGSWDSWTWLSGNILGNLTGLTILNFYFSRDKTGRRRHNKNLNYQTLQYGLRWIESSSQRSASSSLWNHLLAFYVTPTSGLGPIKPNLSSPF